MNEIMAEESVGSSLRIPQWNGKATTYALWLMKMQAFMNVKGVGEAILSDFLTKLPPKEKYIPQEVVPLTPAEMNAMTALQQDDERAKRLALVNQVNESWKRYVTINTVAVAYLTQAFTCEKAIAKIYQSKSDEWPGGRADLIIAGLNEGEAPQDSILEAELLLQITSLSIKKNKDPGNLAD